MANLIPIQDIDDPRIEPYRNLRERDLIGRRKGFIAEGEVVLRELVRVGRYGLASVLLSERRVERLRPLLETLPPATPIYCAPQPLLDAVCGFALHRGVLALGELPEPVEPAALLSSLGPTALILCLFAISNHDNIGGIFRNAAAFGVDAVLLDPQCCEPLYRKAIRVSVGAVLTVPFTRLPPQGDTLQLLRDFGFEALALTPAGGMRLHDVDATARTAVLLGSEGHGLAPGLLAQTRGVSIPMANGFDSLNVATTSGIVLHHLTRDR